MAEAFLYGLIKEYYLDREEKGMSPWQKKKQRKNFQMILAFDTLSVSSCAVFLTTAFFFSYVDNSVLKATFRPGSAL